MTTSPDGARERAEEEAAKWLIRLVEEPSNADLRARFEAWRAVSDVNAEMWARTARAYDLVGEVRPHHVDHEHHQASTQADGRGARCTVGSQTRTARAPLRTLGMGLAATTLAAGLLITLMTGLSLRLQADVVTAAADLRSHLLPDGTRAHLAPESALDVTFEEHVRRVRLLQGEVFFEVAPDPARPFRVDAGSTVATALGTAFEVRHRGSETAVFVEQGRVRVEDGSTPSASPDDVSAGEWVRLATETGSTRGGVHPDDIAAWRRGELVARNQPLDEVVDVLRRYHVGVIVIQSGDFAARRVSGIYDLENPAQTLRDLATAHGARVLQLSPWLIVVTDA